MTIFGSKRVVRGGGTRRLLIAGILGGALRTYVGPCAGGGGGVGGERTGSYVRAVRKLLEEGVTGRGLGFYVLWVH